MDGPGTLCASRARPRSVGQGAITKSRVTVAVVVHLLFVQIVHVTETAVPTGAELRGLKTIRSGLPLENEQLPMV